MTVESLCNNSKCGATFIAQTREQLIELELEHNAKSFNGHHRCTDFSLINSEGKKIGWRIYSRGQLDTEHEYGQVPRHFNR